MWQAKLISQPPPKAYPFTAAITGLGEFSIADVNCCPALAKTNASSELIFCIFFISAPAINAFSPDPEIIITPTVSSLIEECKAESNSLITSSFIAFIASGLLIVSQAI